jgi:hypothetical protein
MSEILKHVLADDYRHKLEKALVQLKLFSSINNQG